MVNLKYISGRYWIRRMLPGITWFARLVVNYRGASRMPINWREMVPWRYEGSAAQRRDTALLNGEEVIDRGGAAQASEADRHSYFSSREAQAPEGVRSGAALAMDAALANEQTRARQQYIAATQEEMRRALATTVVVNPVAFNMAPQLNNEGRVLRSNGDTLMWGISDSRSPSSVVAIIDTFARECATNNIYIGELIVSDGTYYRLSAELPSVAVYAPDRAGPQVQNYLVINTTMGQIRISREMPSKTPEIDWDKYMEDVD